MSKIKLGAYFYPLTTSCSIRNKSSSRLGHKPVDEINLAQNAQPRFQGHSQPKLYCLGEKNWVHWDDADLSAMDRQVGLAKDHKLDFFLFDSYMGKKNGHFVQEMNSPLDSAFLSLEESKNFKFALMLVLSSPRSILPVPRIKNFEESNREYEINKDVARQIVDICMQKYWQRQNYFTIDGRPYISLFVSDFSASGERRSYFRLLIQEILTYSHRRYRINPYLVGVVRKIYAARDLVSAGVHALTGYAYLPDFGPEVLPLQDYQKLVLKRKREWRQIKDEAKISFVPPAVVGWDASPRGEANFSLKEIAGYYPFTPIVVNGSPEKFEGMLRESLLFTEKTIQEKERYGIICSWNEITEGSALLPTIQGGRIDYGYLKAVYNVARMRNNRKIL
mgnify:CR=1 FL=1